MLNDTDNAAVIIVTHGDDKAPAKDAGVDYELILARDIALYRRLVFLYNMGAPYKDIYDAVGTKSPVLASYLRWGLFSGGYDLREEDGGDRLDVDETPPFLNLEYVRTCYLPFVKEDGTWDRTVYPDIDRGL